MDSIATVSIPHCFKPVGQSAQISGESPEAAHILPFRIPARRNSGPVLFRADIDACRIQIDPLQLRRKRHFALRYNADLRRRFAPVGVVLMGAPPLTSGFIRTQRARRCARCILPNGITWPSPRVTNDVGAFLRNHANGRAQGTNERLGFLDPLRLAPFTPNPHATPSYFLLFSCAAA